MIRLTLASLLIFACAGHAALAQNDDAFARANQEYASGKFAEAIELYESVARAREPGAVLFYNLGNAHFRAGDLGHAILNYERALMLEPHHPEAEANLRLVRDKARALQLKRDRLDRALMQFTTKEYSIAAAVSFWMAAFALIALIYARRRTPAFTGLLALSLLAFAASVYAVYSFEIGGTGRDLAIVTAKSTDARLATADSAGTVLTLPAGSEVRILSTRGDWSYAALPNDLRGWISAQSAERVRL